MQQKSHGDAQRTQNLKNAQRENPNWVLIAGGALLSTLIVRLGCKLKQTFEARRSNNSNTVKGHKSATSNSRQGLHQSHSNLDCFVENEDGCRHSLSGISNGRTGSKYRPTSPPVNCGVEFQLPLVRVPTAESSRENEGVMWASSPGCLELPHKPFHRSHCSESPCVSESGSDVYVRREVIHKLRQQLRMRDEMILEMQEKITNLQNSLTNQLNQSVHLQSQLDSITQDLFDSESKIQRLRKVMTDNCTNRHSNHSNGFLNLAADLAEVEKARESERVKMLEKQVKELKELIEGKEYIIQSYKEQKLELCSQIKELQQRLESQVPNTLQEKNLCW